MRKIIAVLIMACAIGFYVFHVMNVGNNDAVAKAKKSDIELRLDDYKKELTDHYPETPADVMKIYNGLLETAYSGKMTDDEAKQYVQIVRLMYSAAFNELNPEETQLKNLLDDLSYNKQNGISIVVSNVREVNILQDEDGSQKEASVNVEHAMNVSGVARKYLLINEDGKWKINGWESKQAENTEE